MIDWLAVCGHDAGRDAVALIVFSVRSRSRRAAKRKLRDLGLAPGRAADLDDMLAALEAFPADIRADVDRRVLALQQAHAAAAVGELAPLDLGEVLGDIVWLDEIPNHHERAELYARASAALRGYDALLDSDDLGSTRQEQILKELQK